ncbi:hypothetical protein INT43_000249 [Umbelopsis isabellina]|uniref:Uncharacterized protein n=1 Tax=Mortierella isabellina TaxID=91625 RepID=A0A8H7UAV2_MORIS|nr:hypothetical protein INT43_000249 [Umbelopsis isabellina]
MAIGYVAAAPANEQGTGVQFVKRAAIPPQCQAACKRGVAYVKARPACDPLCHLTGKEYEHPRQIVPCSQCIGLPYIFIQPCYACIDSAK